MAGDEIGRFFGFFSFSETPPPKEKKTKERKKHTKKKHIYQTDFATNNSQSTIYMPPATLPNRMTGVTKPSGDLDCSFLLHTKLIMFVHQNIHPDIIFLFASSSCLWILKETYLFNRKINKKYTVYCIVAMLSA